jgi:methionyl-tRNA formyltransferase
MQRFPQSSGTGTFHHSRDVETIDEIQLDRNYTARELINILRARTFPPHPGAYFLDGGRKVYLRLQLLYEDELSEGSR